MNAKDFQVELLRLQAEIDQTLASTQEINQRLEGLHQQLERLYAALDARRRRELRWNIIQFLANVLMAFGLTTLALVLMK